MGSPQCSHTETHARTHTHTFTLEEVEGAEEASAAPGGGLGSVVAQQLRELGARQVDEAADVAQHQLQEDVGAVVPELLHKEVRVEDDGGPAGAGAPRGVFQAADHVTPRSAEETQDGWIKSFPHGAATLFGTAC